jgi:hypothetical protein
VCETLNSGWVQTAPATGCYTISLTSGQVDGDNDFGNRLANGSLSGFVYADIDADGQRKVDVNGVAIELGLPQVEIALWRNGQLVQTDQTGPDGWYHFEDLEPGTYDVVQVTQPACFLDGTETVGIVLPGGESRGVAGADRITGIAISADEHGIEYNFGELGLRAACVNKRMLFGSAEPRRATVYEPLAASSAVVHGTPDADQINVQAVGDSATLVTDDDLDLLARAVAFERVRAIPVSGGTDEINETPPLGYELEFARV